MTKILATGNRCDCYNGHRSASGRCHNYKPFERKYCEQCVAECGMVEPEKSALDNLLERAQKGSREAVAELQSLYHDLAQFAGDTERLMKALNADTIQGALDNIAQLHAENAEIREAVKTAVDLAEEGLSYTDDYFVKKWGLDTQLAELKAVLAKYPKEEK